jgi:CRISPR-associated endonuclease/helicase Cas3
MLRDTIGPDLDLSTVDDRWVFEGTGTSIRDERKRINDRILHPFHRELELNLPRRRLLHAVRAALIAADAAGSGLTRTGKPITDWILETLEGQDPWNGNDAELKVIEPRIAELNRLFAEKGWPPFQWTDFQNDCADPVKVPSRALLLAPCGSGKTLAAWRWIVARLMERPAGHVLFLYPTRTTATEGFRDYVSWAPEAEATLMHGTSEFDLAGMFDNESDPGTASVMRLSASCLHSDIGDGGRSPQPSISFLPSCNMVMVPFACCRCWLIRWW